MPASFENFEKIDVPDSEKREKIFGTLKKFSFLFFILLVIGLVIYFFNNFGISDGMIYKLQGNLRIDDYRKFDTRLLKYYVTKNMEVNDLIIYAAKDCHEQGFDKTSGNLFLTHKIYLDELRERILLHLGLDPGLNKQLSYQYIPISDTDVCYIIGIYNSDGKGILGYENISRELVLFYSRFQKDFSFTGK